jgi:hypothetical protein
MNGVSAVFLTPQIDVATFVEHKKGQGGKGYESNRYFPHLAVSIKKDPRPMDESLSSFVLRRTLVFTESPFSHCFSLWRRYPRPWFP